MLLNKCEGRHSNWLHWEEMWKSKLELHDLVDKWLTNANLKFILNENEKKRGNNSKNEKDSFIKY